jgi:hypothetical protein
MARIHQQYLQPKKPWLLFNNSFSLPNPNVNEEIRVDERVNGERK